MNGLSRKLHELEKNELELPEDDEIFLHIGDADEIELHNHAQTIRGTVRAEAEEIISNIDLTVEQQNDLSKQLLARLTERERAILEQSGNFVEYRLKRLLYKYFAAGYPKGEDSRVMLRILWFFCEMDKLNYVNHLEDYEFEHNRNEEDLSFNDFAWWDALEAEKLSHACYYLILSTTSLPSTMVILTRQGNSTGKALPVTSLDGRIRIALP
jgi:hypothetical protein